MGGNRPLTYGDTGGRYWVRTSDLFGVNEARYHCANRPLWCAGDFSASVGPLRIHPGPAGNPLREPDIHDGIRRRQPHARVFPDSWKVS